jgi:hypothetical protein
MVEQEIRNMKNMSLHQLRTLYLEYTGQNHVSINKRFYIQKLAYRMQEVTYGGLPSKLMKQLLEGKITKYKRAREGIPPAGTRLVKTYRGQEHEVRILVNGFEYQGKIYRSLSAIAFKISGKKQWGTFFFGLYSGGKNGKRN